ncbi:MAG: hypothetical protein U9R60_15125, partial [Bacteroidota bacterium]|nr:hypothetical protein [Bacteroidota bacterium]
MSKFIIPLAFAIFFIACRNTHQEQKEYTPGSSPEITINVDDIIIEGDLGPFEISMESREIENGIQIISISLSADEPARPPEFELKWSFPSVDIYAFWNSNIRTDKATYYYNNVISRASSQAPVICFMNSSDENRLTLALSDALNKVKTTSFLREEDIRFYYYLSFFS